MFNTMPPRFARRTRAAVLAAAAPMALSLAGLPARAQLAVPITPPSFAVNAGTIGSVVTSGDGLTTTITQTSQRAVLDWQQFSVASGKTLVFAQPNAGAITLNRVAIGGPGTVIDGTISANGKVWILNPSGLFIGAGGRINTAGFLASTGSINTADFMAAASRLTISGVTDASIVNQGQITINAAAGTGYAVLAGMRVENGQSFVSGTTTAEAGNALIVAELNSITLGSGSAFTLDFAGDGLINFAIAENLTAQQTGGGIFNSGTISAAGGTVLMTARAAAGAVGAVINTNGLVEAHSVTLANGSIKLGAVEYAAGVNGTVSISGITDVSAGEGLQAGGKILATGDKIIVSSTATLDATGQGGGEIRLGSAATIAGQAASTVATLVEIAANATLDASATVNGNGGQIIVRSATGATTIATAGTTIAQGTFRASGGSASGNGGLIDIAGTTLNARGIIADATASNGAAGQFTLTAPRFDILDPVANGDRAWLSAPLSQLIGPTDATATTLSDDVNINVPLGFTLNTGGTIAESVFLSANGFLSFTDIGHGCCEGQPFQSAPAGAIYGLWTDLIDSAGSPYYQTRTLADGSKQFVAGWYNTAEYGTGTEVAGTGNLNSFEILLSDTGKVQLNYGGIDVAGHVVSAGLVGTGGATVLPIYHGNSPDSLSYQSFSLASTAGIINAGDVTSILGNGTNVTIVTVDVAPAGLFPDGLGTLTLAAPLTLSTTSNALLTLSAANDLLIGPAGEITGGPNARFNFIADSDNNGSGFLRLDASLRISSDLLGNGHIQLSGNVLVAGNRSLISQGPLSITGTINAVQPGLASIKLQAMNASVTVSGAIGDTSELGSLDVKASSFTSGSINTGSGGITVDVSDASVVQGGVTAASLRISGSGRLWLSGESNQIAKLIIADGWLYTDRIGGIAGTPIVFDGAGNNLLEIESTAPATLANPITLNAAADIELRGTADWTIASAIDAASQTEGSTKLEIKAQGNLVLNSAVGGIQPLTGIDVLAIGKLQLGSNASITTVGEIQLGEVQDSPMNHQV